MMKIIFAVILSIGLCGTVVSQASDNAEDKYQYFISPHSGEIKIDGKLDEGVWSSVQVISDFWLQAPIDNERASLKTEVMMTYDKSKLYIAAICYDNNDYVIQTLKRDDFGESDEFAVVIDPVGKKTNGYGFGVNAEGAQTEVLVTAGGTDDSWDNRWTVKTTVEDDRWIVEMSIPFKTLRFEKNQTEWRVNFIRIEPGNNETHTWYPIPRQFSPLDIGYFGKIMWPEPPTNSGANISFIPYTAAKTNKIENTDLDSDVDIGIDAKVGLTSTINLDLTLNPDFSQVEVDQQVTNLSRFSIFFPERRQFFIENGDIFFFGQGVNLPFYSRRIGLDASGRTVPILYGARLTGNITDKTRVGVFNIHSRGVNDVYGQNFSAAAVHHRVGKRSLIKGVFLNRQAYDGSESVANDYGRNGGLEIDLSTEDGKWQLNGGYLHSFKNGIEGDNNQIHSGIFYNGTKFRTFLQFQHIGKNYFTDMGFNSRINNFDPATNSFSRIGYSQVGNMINYYIYPENSKVDNFHWSGLENFVWITDDGYGLTEWYTRLRHFIFFKNTSQLRFRLNNHYVDLIFPFAITAVPIPAKSYNMTEFNFSTALFWTTFLQYNTQADNFNVNSRLQWRFAPMSDLLLVFTDNYRIENMFGSKDRTVALKLNYWLSM